MEFDNMPLFGRAVGQEDFRALVEKLAGAYLGTSKWPDHPEYDDQNWCRLRSAHFISLLGTFITHAQHAAELQFDDVQDDLNPLRLLWTLCFRDFAQKSIKATNFVTPKWTSSAQTDGDRIQKFLKGKGVQIQRIYIFDRDALSEQVMHNLRYAIIRQMHAGVEVRHIRPQLMETRVDFAKLKTTDFIVFDSSLVYCTHIDSGKVNSRSGHGATYVRLHSDPEMVEYASNAWEEIAAHSDLLTMDNVAEYVDPYV